MSAAGPSQGAWRDKSPLDPARPQPEISWLVRLDLRPYPCYERPNTSFACSETRTNVVRFENSRSRLAPT